MKGEIYEDALVQTSRRIRKFRQYLQQFNVLVQEVVEKNGVGTQRMDRMVNGTSKPIRKKVIEELIQKGVIDVDVVV